MEKAARGLKEEWSIDLDLSRGQVDDIETILAGVEMFKSLAEDELLQVERIVHPRTYHRQEVIVRQGDPGVGMYIIQSGSADVLLEVEDGGVIPLARLGERQFFGEMSLLDGAPRAASVVAVERTLVIGFFRADLMDLIARSPQLGFKIVFRLSQLMNARLRETLQEFRDAQQTLRALEGVREGGDRD